MILFFWFRLACCLTLKTVVERILAFVCQLIKRMEELKEEKEKLAVDIMHEEEFLTNTLQRKLAQVLWLVCASQA